MSTDHFRIDDDAALRAKVDEAMTVYDEYVKNKAGEKTGSTAESGVEVPSTSEESKKPESTDDKS
jgi:polyadenylate-binding protein